MVTGFYFVVFLCSIIMLLRVLLGNKKVDSLVMLITILFVVNCLGRYLLASAPNLEMALFGNTVIYVGACYIPLSLVLILARLCNLKVPKALLFGMCAYSTLILGLVLTIGKLDIYYASAELAFGNGYNYLIKTYGPTHSLYFIMNIFYIGIMAFYMVYALGKRKDIPTRTVVTMSGVSFAVFFMYVLERVFKLNISFLTMGYLVGIILLMVYYNRVDMYDMKLNVFNSVERIKEYGYIAFDNKHRYVNSNELAKELFPEIRTWVVDKAVPVSDSVLYKDVVSMMREWDGKNMEEKDIEIDGSFFQVNIKYISHGKQAKVGYLFEFIDRTFERNYYTTLEEYGSIMEHEVELKTEELRAQQKRTEELFVRTVMALSEAVDAKDRYTRGHSQRVAEYARMIASRMGKSKLEQEEIYRAGLLHDVGKIRIPENIINKPGRLTDEEFNVMKIHSNTGYHILRGISDNDVIAIGSRYHHERYDGKGYPNGIKGERIPEVARILGVADAYDAMTSNRSYRKALPQEVARREIEGGKGSQFDPAIADIMLQMIEEDKDYQMRQMEEKTRLILAIDEDMMNNQILAHIMEDEPLYEIMVATGRKEALEILSEKKIDLILLDIEATGTEGMETFEQIKEKYAVPIVVTTSNKHLINTGKLDELGCEEYMTKPYSPFLVKEVIHTIIEK